MKSKQDLVNDAFNYAINFYSNNDRHLDNQFKCLHEMMRITGLDDITCVKIQDPILFVLRAQNTINIGNEAIQNLHRIVSDNLRSHMVELGVQNFQHIPTSEMKDIVDRCSSEQSSITSRYQNLMKGFTGQVLGGANHDQRHCREYNEAPQVNKEMLAAVRKIDREGTSKSVNFMLFHKHNLNDDDMYWLSSIFNYHGPKGLAVNTVDLSNNDITLTRDPNLTYVDLPFFSFNAPYNTPRNILRLDLSNNNIGDAGAKIVADGLANGVFPITKQINLAGNKITEFGQAKLIEGVRVSTNTDLNVITVKAGWKDGAPHWKTAAKYALNKFLSHAKSQGIDTEHVATNKSALDYILDGITIGKNIVFGVAKCSNTLLEILSFNTNAPSITKGFALEMYGTKAMKKADFKVCVLLETHDAFVSNEGVDLAVKAVEILGDSE